MNFLIAMDAEGRLWRLQDTINPTWALSGSRFDNRPLFIPSDAVCTAEDIPDWAVDCYFARPGTLDPVGTL